MIPPGDLVGIARDILERTGVTPPVDAFELADLCGFSCVPWSRGGGDIDLVSRRIRFPRKARPVHQQGVVAHELAHFAIWRGHTKARPDCEDEERPERDEVAAKRLAGMLLVPGDALERDVKEIGLDLFELRTRHPNASAQMISVRLCQVMPGTWAEVWDQGRRHAQYGNPPMSVEPMVDRALATEQPVTEDWATAWPIISPRTPGSAEFRRVIVIGRVA